MPNGTDTDAPPRGWPRCGSEQTRVMVLGTYHMANPGKDVVNVEADDVLAPDRQAECEELVDHLAEWSPDRVALELPAEWQSAVEGCYETYRTGERAYDRAESFPDPFPDRFSRNEAVQVGFRLADRCDHLRPITVDHDSRVPETTSEEAMAAAMHGFPAPADAPYPLPDPDEVAGADERRLAESSLVEYHRWMNADEQLRENHALMFAGGLEHADDEAGVGMLSAWYERNLRTVRTLWERLDADDERVLLLFGSGHVRVLRHFLDETPMCCPVSPLTAL